MEKETGPINKDIAVEVKCRFVPEESDLANSYFFFAYTITITNNGSSPSQLIERHWTITDGFGKSTVVDGAGVVGKQPVLGPGQSFEYTSFCPLSTPTGSMQGYYDMRSSQGIMSCAQIPVFFLMKDNLYH